MFLLVVPAVIHGPVAAGPRSMRKPVSLGKLSVHVTCTLLLFRGLANAPEGSRVCRAVMGANGSRFSQLVTQKTSNVAMNHSERPVRMLPPWAECFGERAR